VSSQSNVKKVAGAICTCIKIGGFPPALLAKGTAAINQAIKAIAVARGFLGGDETDLIAQPSFDGRSAGCVIHVRRSGPIEVDDSVSALTVTNKTDPYKLAGAIAGKIREKERCSLSAMGPLAVFHAVEALDVTRTYLREERIDIKFTPQFKTVNVDSLGDRTAVYFACLPRRV